MRFLAHHGAASWREQLEGKAANGMSRVGILIGVEALTYNPLQMRLYQRRAVDEAPKVIGALRALFPDVQSVVDVGAGTGVYVAEAKRQGLAARGCEHSRSGRRRARAQGADCVAFDLSKASPARLDGTFDLAFSIEVAEHLAPRLGDRLVEFVAALAPSVFWTAARPRQGGLGHINEQPAEYWDERFERNGRPLDEEATARLHDEFSRRGVTAHWLLNNARVYRADHNNLAVSAARYLPAR